VPLLPDLGPVSFALADQLSVLHYPAQKFLPCADEFLRLGPLVPAYIDVNGPPQNTRLWALVDDQKIDVCREAVGPDGSTEGYDG
jgi:hypothetical protein